MLLHGDQRSQPAVAAGSQCVSREFHADQEVSTGKGYGKL